MTLNITQQIMNTLSESEQYVRATANLLARLSAMGVLPPPKAFDRHNANAKELYDLESELFWRLSTGGMANVPSTPAWLPTFQQTETGVVAMLQPDVPANPLPPKSAGLGAGGESEAVKLAVEEAIAKAEGARAVKVYSGGKLIGTAIAVGAGWFFLDKVSELWGSKEALLNAQNARDRNKQDYSVLKAYQDCLADPKTTDPKACQAIVDNWEKLREPTGGHGALWWLGTFVVISAVGAGGYYWWQQRKKRLDSPETSHGETRTRPLKRELAGQRRRRRTA